MSISKKIDHQLDVGSEEVPIGVGVIGDPAGVENGQLCWVDFSRLAGLVDRVPIRPQNVLGVGEAVANSGNQKTGAGPSQQGLVVKMVADGADEAVGISVLDAVEDDKVIEWAGCVKGAVAVGVTGRATSVLFSTVALVSDFKN